MVGAHNLPSQVGVSPCDAHAGQMDALPEPTTLDQAGTLIERGTAAFLRTNLALFAAGFATFALLYCVQPLMPEFSRDFGVSPFSASLSLSLTTGLIAVCILFASAVSETLGRKKIMVASLAASAVLTVVASVMPHWPQLLAVRALMGITLSGLPAVAMAYVSEEMHPRSIGLAMGLYVGGSGLGGMSGRLLTGVLTDAAGWRVAIGAIGLLGIVAAGLFAASLPPSRNFVRQAPRLGPLAAAFGAHLRDPVLRRLFAAGFCLMGSFVTLYNYIGYRLLAPPFALSQSHVGLLFTVYLVGIVSAAWMGDLGSRLGRGRVFWAGIVLMLGGAWLTLPASVWAVVAGIALLTFGFFGAHSIASAWVAAQARQARAQASALYLFCYYLGSSVAGSIGGLAWARFGWHGVLVFTSTLTLAGLGIAVRLSRPASLR